MLQNIRDHTQGWIAGIIISLLILSFALWGIHSYFVGAATSNVVAKVNGVEITKGQLAVTYERLRRQLQIQFSSNYELPPGAEASLKERALQSLINIQVLKQASIDQDYRISARQIDNFLESMPEFQVNGQFSLNRLQQILSTTLFTLTDFLDLLKTTLLIDQPRLGILLTSFSLPSEVVNTISLINQQRNIQYLIVPFQYFLDQPITISDDKVLAYYQQHQEEFKTPEQMSVSYLELSVKNIMSTLHPTDEILKNFYNENTNSFAQPMHWKLESLMMPILAHASEQEIIRAREKMDEVAKKAKKGEDFSTLAQRYSLSKMSGQSSDWMTLNQVPMELQRSLLTFTKPGLITEPVQTSNGFVLLKVVDFKEAHIQSFEKVKEKVKEAYVRQQAEEKFADLREKLANITYEHPESLEPAATALNLPIKTTEVFTKDKGGKDEISSISKVREAAFSHDVLSLQNNSDVIQLGSDRVLVLRIKSHAPATLLPLKVVQQQIIDKLKTEEVNAKTLQLATDIKQKLQEGNATAMPEQIAQQYHFAWNQAGWIGRHSTKVDASILETAFKISKPSESNVDSYAITKVANGYVIVALKEILEGNVNDLEEQEVFADQIQNAQGLLEYELYKQSLMKHAKIVVES